MMSCGSLSLCIGKDSENSFMSMVYAIGWEPVYFRNPSGVFDVLIHVNNKWYKIQVKKACRTHKCNGNYKSYSFHNTRSSGWGKYKKKVFYKPVDLDMFAIDVDGDFYIIPYSHVYQKDSDTLKKRVHIEKDAKYKLSNILKSYKNGKYYVGDEIIF